MKKALALREDIFLGGDTAGAAGANPSNIQLWNPGTNSKLLEIISCIFAYNGASGGIDIASHGVAITTLGTTPVNINSFGAAGDGQIRIDNAGPFGTTINGGGLFLTTTNSIDLTPLLQGMIIGANESVILQSTINNIEIRAMFKWREYDG